MGPKRLWSRELRFRALRRNGKAVIEGGWAGRTKLLSRLKKPPDFVPRWHGRLRALSRGRERRHGAREPA